MTDPAGFVVIGRNEGERLRRCLQGLIAPGRIVVYVDSGSSDGSPALARSLGAEVHELSADRPFSAARARNEGFEQLTARAPGLRYLQFVDGDSELDPGWEALALKALEARPDACAAIGRLREKAPGDSLYNRLCDLEWNLPLGEVHCFGGLCMMRVEAFRKVKGFDLALPAGEEPELSQRLRRDGWKILSMDAEMARHDAALRSFGQWWRRSLRSGQAYAQVCSLGSGIRGRFGLRQVARTWFWVVLFPALAAASVLVHRVAGPATAAGLFALQLLRIAAGTRRKGASWGTALGYALLWWPGQLAQWLGHGRFLLSRLRRRPPTLLEVKPVPPPGGGDA